jgi:hypothetical protein
MVLNYSCSKENSKPIEEVIVGKWIFSQYSTDFGNKQNVELQRLLDSILLRVIKKDIAADFAQIVEFTADNAVILYDGSYETYAIVGDSLLITNDGTGEGFPIVNAKVWTNNTNWLTISTRLANYLDLEAIYDRVNLDEKRRDKLENGNLHVVFKRYAAQ